VQDAWTTGAVRADAAAQYRKSGDTSKVHEQGVVRRQEGRHRGLVLHEHGDMASKGTGAVSSTVDPGKTEFAAPVDERQGRGQNIQLLGDAMTNTGLEQQGGNASGNVAWPLLHSRP